MGWTIHVLTTLICLTAIRSGQGDEDLVNHLLLLDSLPEGFSTHSAIHFDIRTNFSGNVQIVESKDFMVVVNITAPTLQQAYEVNAQLFSYHSGVVLEVKEQRTLPTVISVTWLLIGIGVATLLVFLCTAGYAIKWYKKESLGKYEVPDHKSIASSSQRGNAYRTGNIIPMVPFAAGGRGENLIAGDETDNSRRCDEELRQVPELPEEEEAEALEMLTKQKLHEDIEMSGENEDSDPQERNLIKSRYHSQAKTVHKEMIKKASAGKKSVSYKRTLNGVYKGLPTEQEETSNDENELELKSSGMETDFSFQDLQVVLDGEKSAGTVKEELLLTENSNEPAYANDPMLLVSADVHKDNPRKMEVVCITKDKPAKVGNMYVTPSELKPVMSTFGPGMTSTPKNAPVNNTIVDSGKHDEHSTTDNNFHNVPDKPRRDVPWFTENLPVMGDILEDPHEDQQSIVSDSANSASMYGSSEIFDIQDPENTYYNLDSDFDIPPLDAEDILSDGGLPSPLGLPLYKMRTKGKANDDIKLIPGALKSPGPNANRLVQKPRPNSSIILSAGNIQRTKTPGPSKSSDSPPLPPHPDDKGVSQVDTVFQFPPPPKMFSPHENVPWDKRTKPTDPESAGEYVQIKQPKNQTSSSPQQTSFGPGASVLNPTYMNLTILSTLCIISLASGVYSALNDKSQTRVDIIIYTPKHLLNNTTRIFFNYNKETDLVNNDNFIALVYDVTQPLLVNKVNHFNKCWNITCDHGCDEVTGSCICFKGFKLIATGECVDVNECMEGKAKCDQAAGCYNRKGSYDCICGEDYYGNGKKCRECKQECPEKHYEVQPCSPEIQKICKPCTQICRNGYYMAKPCSSHENAICRVCKPECLPGEYESRQCTNDHDRECKNVSKLELPETSKNVILEEKNHIKDDSAILDKLPAHYVGFTRYKLNRGTGLFLDLTVRFIDAALQFLPVNTSQSINFEGLMPNVLKSYPVQRVCPNPVPDYYILRYNKHEGLTYKQNDNGSLEDCETHRVYGEPNLPSTANRQSFLCSQPGTLTNIFNMDDNFFLARTKWVDKSKRCQRYSQACETCIRDCGTAMFSGDQTCNVGADENDDGVSPRLKMCYNCCVKKNCSADCKDYHKRRCQPEQCLKGNLLEFTLVSSWDSSQDGRFFCHIAPVSRQLLLELEYVVRWTSSQNPLLSNTVKIYGDEAWETTGFSRHNDGILDIMINSSLGTVPNILEGKTTQDSSLFKVGTYKSRGSKFGTSAISPMFVYLRPVTPHGIPPMPPAHQECTHTALNDMLLASNMEDPYIHNSKLEAIINHSMPYVVTNKDEQPQVKAVLSRHTAILNKLFSPAVLNVSSFLANLVQNSSHWVVMVSGRVIKCPGYLHIRLHGPIYPSEVVFDCDAVILCPKSFSVKFALPMSDRMGTAKDVIIEVKDEKNVHHFRIYRRSSIVQAVDDKEEASSTIQAMASPMKETQEPTREHLSVPTKETSNLPLPLPYLLAVGGIIVLLLVLAIIGLCFQPGLPKDTYARWYHPIFAVIHMVFQFVYSVVVSGTMFFVILTIITNDNVNFLLQHGQSGGISLAPVHIELLKLQRHLESEISRQDSQADAMQKDCLKDVKQIVMDLKNLHQTVLQSTEDVFDRHRLDLLLNQQKLHVRDKLSRDLTNFRNAYATSAKSVLRQVNQNAQASFQNILHNNTWLVGTRFLYEAVQLLRKTHGKDGKTFMDWTGIKGDLAQLEIDLTFSLPALPRLDDLIDLTPDELPVKRNVQENFQLNEPIRSIQIHNNWFFPLEESSLTQRKLSQSSHIDSQQPRNETSYPFYIFLGLLLVCDLVLLAHRMCKAWTSTKLIIFGFPEYVRKKKGDDEDEVFPPADSSNKLAPVQSCHESPVVMNLKLFLTQTISTTFFPKVVGSVAACFVLFCLLRLSNKYLTSQELGRMGLYQSNDQYLHLQMSMTNARLETHANYINSVNLPAFQSTVHGYIARHRTVVEIYNRHLTGLQGLTIEMYCEHLKTIGVSGNCSDIPKKQSKDMDSVDYFTPTCKFQPVVPQLFKRNVDNKIPLSERQLEALLENLRYIIYYTSQLTVIFLAIIVLKELACSVLWILIQRSGVIHIRIIVEQDESL